MNKLSISIILPFPVTKPVGGAKIMYEYANRLLQRGHQVTVYHSIKRPFKKSSTPVWYKQAIFALRGVARPKWFPLNKEIKSLIVPEITDRYLPDADIVLSTWWQMTYAINALSASKGEKFNLIQDYEIWAGHQEKVDASFSLPVNHLVIAKYLEEMVFDKTGGARPLYLPNAIDNNKFFIQTDPALRNPHSIIMLYSGEPRKDSATGITALMKLKEKYTDLEVQLFGVYPSALGSPEFMNYIQRPGDLPALYNKAAIFLSPSLGEGWALPPAEAMACGCAVVCTDIGGHHDYAIHGSTALLVKPGQVNDMVEKISSLLDNQELRIQIASSGNNLITSTFSWEQSVTQLESFLHRSIKK